MVSNSIKQCWINLKLCEVVWNSLQYRPLAFPRPPYRPCHRLLGHPIGPCIGLPLSPSDENKLLEFNSYHNSESHNLRSSLVSVAPPTDLTILWFWFKSSMFFNWCCIGMYWFLLNITTLWLTCVKHILFCVARVAFRKSLPTCVFSKNHWFWVSLTIFF